MKTAKEILSQMYKPHEPKLKQVKLFDNFVVALPKSLSTSIKYMYKRNDNIFIVIDNPVLKQEFNYKISFFKELLNLISQEQGMKLHLQHFEIKIQVSYVKINNYEHYETQSEHFIEKARGNFKNLLKDENLKQILEKIRQNIRNLD